MGNTSKNDVASLVKGKAGSALGLTPSSSSIIVNNLNANTLPMCVGVSPAQIETDNNVILFFVLDQSPSMTPVEQEVIDGLNKVLVPALKAASKKNVQSLLVGGVAFNERVTPLWGGGFQQLQNLPNLTRRDYNTGSGHSTALHQAVLDSLTATTTYASDLMQNTGTPPRVIIVVLSDGANNCPPMSTSDVRRVTKDLSPEIFTLAFAGFETGEPVDFHEIASEMGFSVYESKQQGGETEADMQRRFRHLINFTSSSIVTASQTQVGASQSKGFWQTA